MFVYCESIWWNVELKKVFLLHFSIMINWLCMYSASAGLMGKGIAQNYE